MSTARNRTRNGSPLSAKRVVVTGGGGFLGTVVIRKLYERGCRMIVAPSRSRYDLSRAEDVAGLLDRVQPELLLHLAAAGDADGADSAQAFCDNVLMTTQVMEAAWRRGVGKMVCLGSASSYPANAPSPLREEDLFSGLPESANLGYGIAKRLPLIQAQLCHRQYGFPCVFLIPASLYGPGDHFNAFGHPVAFLIRAIVEAAESHSSEVVLPGDGRTVQDYLHVEDCAEGVLLAVEKYGGAEPANLGTGEGVSLADLAAKIADLAEYSGGILWDGACSSPAAVRVLDVSRARQELGFCPRVGLEAGLRETLASYRALRAQRGTETAQNALFSHI